MSVRPILLALAAMIFVACGCTPEAGGSAVETSAEPLRIAAAANLAPILDELCDLYHEETGQEARYSLGSSGSLALQASEGAPFDVFLSADMDRVAELVGKGVAAPDSARPYAEGVLAVWMRADSKPKMTSIEDIGTLDDGRLRIAVANPAHAPYGRAAIEVLDKFDLSKRFDGRVVYAENVGQALQFAGSGNVDVAFVAKSLVMDKPGRMVEIPAEFHAPIVQGLCIMTRTRNPEGARRFCGLLLGPRGSALLGSHGFRPLAGPESSGG